MKDSTQLLDVQVNQFHCYVVICYAVKETNSQFQVIASCLVEGFGEIWRIVERATCTGGVTVFTIPESVCCNTQGTHTLTHRSNLPLQMVGRIQYCQFHMGSEWVLVVYYSPTVH